MQAFLTYLAGDIAANGLVYLLTVLIAVVAFCLAHGTYFDIIGVRQHRRLTDDPGNRMALTAMITGLVGVVTLVGLPVGMAAGAMIAAWLCFHHGVNLALGPCPHRLVTPRLIESKPPVGYRIVKSQALCLQSA